MEETTTFKNAYAALQHLAAEGWKVKKTQFYNHVAAGRLRPGEGGAFELGAVTKYARTFLKRTSGAGRTKSVDLDHLQEKRLRAEVEKIEGQARVWTLRARVQDESYVPRDFFERELVKRAIIFRNDLENFCRTEAAGIISLSEGNTAMLPDVVEYMLERINIFLARYAEEKEFTIPPPASSLDDLATEDEEGEEEKNDDDDGAGN